VSFVSGKVLLEKAHEFGFALATFYTSDLKSLKTVLSVAQELESPIVVYTPESFPRNYIKETSRIPLGFYSRVKDFSSVFSALRSEHTVLSIEPSLNYEESIEFIRKVVSLCVPFGIAVEAVLNKSSLAEDFALRTGVDALVLKYPIRLEILREIKKNTCMPLVLEGIGKKVSKEYLKDALELGVNKLNVEMDLSHKKTSEIARLVESSIKLCGSEGKASLFW